MIFVQFHRSAGDYKATKASASSNICGALYLVSSEPLHLLCAPNAMKNPVSNSPVVTKHALEEAGGRWMKQFTNLIHKIEYFRRDSSHDVLAMFCSNSPVVPNTRSMWEMILFTKLQLLFIELSFHLPESDNDNCKLNLHCC